MKASIAILLLTAILFTSCDKNKRASKRFMRPGKWKFVELSVDGSPISQPQYIKVEECDIYDTLCMATWDRGEEFSRIYWQFNDKAERFSISRIVDTADCADFYTELAEQQTYRFSGDYKVLETKRKSKVFESYETLGYPGDKVLIRLEWYE